MGPNGKPLREPWEEVYRREAEACADEAWAAEVTAPGSRWGRGGNKLRTYALFKREVGLEPYLWRVPNSTHRGLIAKLRMGVAPLRIELGRYERTDSGERGIPVESRICQCCIARRVEDEVHFVVECAAFAHERRRLWAACAQCPRMGIPCGQRDLGGVEAKEVFVLIMREPSVACELGRF